MPTSLPFPGTEENRHRLERYLLDHYAASSFNVCEHQPLPMMSGPPLSLTINPNATLQPHHTPIAVPVHWQDEVKAGLDRDVRLGVLEKVPLGTPVTWCHRMVICTKKDGSLRQTINFQPLNQHSTRETHHCPSPFHQARAIPRLTKKTVFDAWNGYHSVALDEQHRHYTTFITPWGRYRYRTAPQGYIASGDAYTARYDSLVAHIGSKTKCIDDALLWSETIEEAFYQAVEWLQICATNGITLNPHKFHFAEDEVEFAGFTVTPTEVRPADKFTAAVREFPTPKGITDIRAWFGLVNQISYAFSMTAAMSPFRHLLRPSTPFLWTNQLTEAFAASKNHICSSIEKGVQIFDKGRPTCLATDWSREAWASGSPRSTAGVNLKIHSAAETGGASSSWVQDSPTQPSPDMPRGGRGIGSGGRIGQSPTFRPRVQRPRDSSGPQTTAQSIQGSLPRGHPEPQALKSEGEDAPVPLPNVVHPWRKKSNQRCPLTPPIWKPITISTTPPRRHPQPQPRLPGRPGRRSRPHFSNRKPAKRNVCSDLINPH